MTNNADSLPSYNLHSQSSSQGSGYPILVAYAAVAVLLIFILSTATVPLLANYVNQLARIYIQMNLESDPALAANYRVDLSPLPNLAMEIIVVPLAKILPLDVAGRIFLWLVLMAQLAGPAMLHRALFKRWSWWPLLALFFLFNTHFYAGFVNAMIGIALALLAAAFWIGFRERSWALRLIVGSLFAVALYFCHLFAVGTYLLLLGSYELVRFIQLPSAERRLQLLIQPALQIGFQVIVPAVLFFMTHLSRSAFVYDFPGWSNKAVALLGPFIGYNLILDVLTVAALGGGMLFLGAKRKLQISLFMLPALGILIVLFLVCPRVFLDTYLVDARFVYIAALTLAGSVHINLGSKTWKRVVVTGLGILIAARFAFVGMAWAQYDKDAQEYRKGFAAVEHGSKVLVAHAMDRSALRFAWKNLPEPRHFEWIRILALDDQMALGVIDKSVYMPNIHMEPGKHPIAPAEGTADLLSGGYIPTLEELGTPDMRSSRVTENVAALFNYWNERYDYLAVIYPQYGRSVTSLAPVEMTAVYEGDLIAVYRIGRDSGTTESN